MLHLSRLECLHRKTKSHITDLLSAIIFIVWLPFLSSSPVIGRQLDILRRFEISEKSCSGFLLSGRRAPGLCMFNFQCQQEGGEVIGSCVDGFLFGACCNLSSKSLEALFSKMESSPLDSQLIPVSQLQHVAETQLTDVFPDRRRNSSTTVTTVRPTDVNLITENNLVTTTTLHTIRTESKEPVVSPIVTQSSTNSLNDNTENHSTEEIFIPNDLQTESPLNEDNHTKYFSSGGVENYASTEPYFPLVSTEIMDKIINDLLEDVDFSTRRNDMLIEESSLTPQVIADIDHNSIFSSSSDQFGVNAFKIGISDDELTQTHVEDTEFSKMTTLQSDNTDDWQTTYSTDQPSSTENSMKLDDSTENFPVSTESSNELNSLNYSPSDETTFIPTSNVINNKTKEQLTTSSPITTDTEMDTETSTGLITTKDTLINEPVTQISNDDLFTVRDITKLTQTISSSEDPSTTPFTVTETSKTKPSDTKASTPKLLVNTTPKSDITTKLNTELSIPNLADPLAIWTTRKPIQQTSKIVTTKDTKSTLDINTTSTSTVTTPQTSTTQKTLLFWTTRPPPTRPQLSSSSIPTTNSLLLIQNGTLYQETFVPENQTSPQPGSGHTQSIYQNVIKKIASNLLSGEDKVEESSTQAWGSSTHPIFTISYDIINNNRVPVLSSNTESINRINIAGFTKRNETSVSVQTLTSSMPQPTVTDTTSTVNQTQQPGTSTSNEMSDHTSSTPDPLAQPPLDIDLLMQLLNLTSYIPEAGIFIPPHLLTTHTPQPSDDVNDIEESHTDNNKTQTSDSQTLLRSTTPEPSTTTILTSPTTTTPTTTTTITTTTTTTTTRPTTRRWDWRKSCGVRPLAREGRIVNGRRADFGEWPWQALVRESTWLGIFTKNKCGGVLINSKYVLTAAHCRPGFLASLIVVLGELDVSGNYEPKKTIQRNVKRVVVHKDFVARTFDNDLALLELESKVLFDEHIIPICMPNNMKESFVGQKGYVSGWGRLSYQGSIPNLLHTVEVPVIPNNECQQWFRESGNTKAIKPEFICAGYKNGKKDSCEGDSGGPLSIKGPDGRWTLAGIVSHGIKCAYPNLPGVYMRMTYYKPWIERVMGTKL